MARKLGTGDLGTVSARKHALDILHQDKGPRSPTDAFPPYQARLPPLSSTAVYYDSRVPSGQFLTSAGVAELSSASSCALAQGGRPPVSFNSAVSICHGSNIVIPSISISSKSNPAEPRLACCWFPLQHPSPPIS